MNIIINHIQLNSKKYENIKYILVNATILLIIAQFDKTFLGTNYSLFILPAIIALMIIRKYLSQSIYLFILLIFIGSHFTFLSEFGGTFGIVAVFVVFYNFLQGNKIWEMYFKDIKMDFLFSILVIFSICGWLLKSQMRTIEMIFSIIYFISLILMFYISSRIVWTEERMLVFIVLLCVIMIYALFTAITNTMHLMPFKSTLWYSYDVEYTGVGSFFYSMIQRPSTAVGAMYFSFLAPFYFIRFKKMKLIYKNKILLIGMLSSAIVCVAGFSKSHTVVLGFAVLVIPFMLLFNTKIGFMVFEKYTFLIIMAVLLLILLNPLFHFETLQKRFEQQPELINSFIKNPLLPKNTTREESFTLAQESLRRENWLIGYGYANGRLNRIAWLGDKAYTLYISKKDFHNTYYSLPQMFGWFGAFSYLAIFIITILRMYKILINIQVNLLTRMFAFSFFMLLLIHLMTEYTTSSLSSPHNMMMVFILLGLANSLFNNIKKGILTAINCIKND